MTMVNDDVIEVVTLWVCTASLFSMFVVLSLNAVYGVPWKVALPVGVVVGLVIPPMLYFVVKFFIEE